jgi:hypothetical protein
MLQGIDWQLVADVLEPAAYQSTLHNRKPSFRLDYNPCFMRCKMVTAALMNNSSPQLLTATNILEVHSCSHANHHITKLTKSLSHLA